jgi:DNA-binding response OmpR family regulator/Tfp pilus assembly protein PilF
MLSVLVVDDDVALLEALRAFLSRVRKAEVRVAKSSREGLSILENSRFDAIVLDYDMPEIDGLAFLKILRSRGDTTPVIFFTGVGREHAAIEALNYGADFFVKKGETPESSLRTVLERIEQAVDGRIAGRPVGAAQKMLIDAVGFSSDPTFAIDNEGKVIAWNEAIEQLTGTNASGMLRRGEYTYAEPFFGKRQKMLIDMVFDTDEEIQKKKYLVISRVKKGPVIGVVRGMHTDGKEWTLWMKAMPLYDTRGNYIATMSSVRDITATVKDVPVPDGEAEFEVPQVVKTEAAISAQTAGSSILDRILGKAKAAYKEGVSLYARELKYREAIAAFDRAIAIDANLGFVWNDRGLCYRELGEYDEALRSFIRAVELSPDDAEIMYDLGETLEKVGIMQKDNKYLDAALQSFHMVVDKIPNNANSWNHIGVCLKEMGKPEESRIYFDRARDVRLWKKDTPIPRKRDEYLNREFTSLF